MTTKKEELSPSTDTLIRSIVLGITLINQLLISMNRNPLPWSESESYVYLSTIATIIISIWNYWKNNSWTYAALKGDEVMHEIKAKEILK